MMIKPLDFRGAGFLWTKHDKAKWEVQRERERVICQAEHSIGISESFGGSSTLYDLEQIHLEIMLLESVYLLVGPISG
jgi:hypothetical protein